MVSGFISGIQTMASDWLAGMLMQVLLFAHDVIGLWAAELTVVSIPALIVGAALGCTMRSWTACLLVSYPAAVGLVYIVPNTRLLHHPLGVSYLMMWAAVVTLPAILASVSLGYFAARWIQTRRAKPRIT
jgi:hypothetical protein